MMPTSSPPMRAAVIHERRIVRRGLTVALADSHVVTAGPELPTVADYVTAGEVAERPAVVSRRHRPPRRQRRGPAERAGRSGRPPHRRHRGRLQSRGGLA